MDWHARFQESGLEFERDSGILTILDVDEPEGSRVLDIVPDAEVLAVGRRGGVANEPDRSLQLHHQEEAARGTDIETGPIHMTGLSGKLAKYWFHRQLKEGPMAFRSSSLGRILTPASRALEDGQARSRASIAI